MGLYWQAENKEKTENIGFRGDTVYTQLYEHVKVKFYLNNRMLIE